MRVAVVGSTGFVGEAVVDALHNAGAEVARVRAPRFSWASTDEQRLMDEAIRLADDLHLSFEGFDAVINAAGNPDASSSHAAELFGANALLPAVLLLVAERDGVQRFVHVSSAVVQNDRPCLDASEELAPFSAYSLSKVMGERTLRALTKRPTRLVRYRPPSVHAPGRRVTRRIARIASSPLGSVAAPGDQHSPQALLANVGAAVAFLATTVREPPPVVIHPWEGLTTRDVMELLGGGRSPFLVPTRLARTLVRISKYFGRWFTPLASNSRRLEILWLGQEQEESWLTLAGFEPPAGREAWRELVGVG